MKISWTVKQENGYVKVFHSKRGLVCAGTFDRDGRIVDIGFLNPADQKVNMIRVPAMTALARWESGILNPIIDARGCSRDTARVHAGFTQVRKH